MEFLKDIVRFNRYKSVESFNNASDITSSTISIVKLDENVMDIYLGRTKLTHSNFPEISDELRNLISSLDSKLNTLKIEFNSSLSSLDKKYNKKLSEHITNFESGFIELVNYTDELSKAISEIKSDSTNIEPIKQDIIKLSSTIDTVKSKLSNIDDIKKTINSIIIKQNTHSNDIKGIKGDIKALQTEDAHIFEILSNIQNKLNSNNIISKDIEKIKSDITSLSKDNKSLKNDIISIKEKIENLSGVDSFETLEDINRRLDKLENTDTSIQETVNNLNETIKNVSNKKLKWLIL